MKALNALSDVNNVFHEFWIHCVIIFSNRVLIMILIHASSEKIPKLVYIDQYNKGLKPVGLWYAPGRTWINWCMNENMPGTCDSVKYYYVVVLRYSRLENRDKHRVLRIKNVDEFDEFNFKYGYVDRKSPFISIRWKEVANDFGGIEIIPYLSNRTTINDDVRKKYGKKNNMILFPSTRFFWYAVFDVASGCVWNPHAVKKFYQIRKKYNKNGLELVEMKTTTTKKGLY